MGLTYERLGALLALTEENNRLDRYEIGTAVALAFNAPKELAQFLTPPRGAIKAPEVTGMLKIPKKKKKEKVNG